jgi:hypothetical protein
VASPSEESSEAPPHQPERPARREFWRLLGLLVPVLITLACVVAGSHLAPPPRRPPFDPAQLNSVRRQKPDVVLIGNSMVETRIDEAVLDKLVAPVRTKVIARGGSSPAVWYAMFKNYVVRLGVKVRRVVFFYRDRELTVTRARTAGPFLASLQRALPGRDPVIEKKIAPRSETPFDKLRAGLGRIAPVERLREPASDFVDAFALKVAGLFAKRSSSRADKKTINKTFEVEKLRDLDAERVAFWDDPRPFSVAGPDSFLPELLKLAKDNGIRLTFVRVRRRRIAAGRPDSAEVVAYTAELERYVKKSGADFVSLSENEWESLDLYGNGDHIAPRFRRRYTGLLVKHHPELFRLP